MNNNYLNTSQFLNIYLRCRNITRQQLAAELHVPYSTLIRWLNSDVRISLGRAKQIKNAIEVNLRLTQAIVLPAWITKDTQGTIIAIIALAFQRFLKEECGEFFSGRTLSFNYLNFLHAAFPDLAIPGFPRQERYRKEKKRERTQG